MLFPISWRRLIGEKDNSFHLSKNAIKNALVKLKLSFLERGLLEHSGHSADLA